MTIIGSLILFNVITVIAYIFAPYHYATHNFYITSIYVLINIVFMKIGFDFGYKYGFGGRVLNVNYLAKIEIMLAKYVYNLYVALFLVKYAYLLRFNIFDISGMAQYLFVGLLDPQMGYAQSLLIGSKPLTIHWVFGIPVLALTGLFFPLAFLSWRKISVAKKWGIVFFTLLEILYWLGRGTNFGFIFLVLIMIYSVVINNDGRFKLKTIIYSAYFLLAVLLVFSYNILSRNEALIVDLDYLAPPLTIIDYDNFWMTSVDKSSHQFILAVFSYLTQGYNSLSFVFDLPFDSSYFGGWNSTLIFWYGFFGFDIEDITYIKKLEYMGIDSAVNWHSAYTWFANDVSFFGVPFIIFVYGFLLGKYQKISRLYRSLVAELIVVYLAVGAIFFFANTSFLSYFFFSLSIVLSISIFIYSKVGKKFIWRPVI